MEKGLVSQLLKDFSFDLPQAQGLIFSVQNEMKKGLDGQQGSIKMLPAFVWSPKGDEAGEYLAIDFGGTNLRIISVKLKGRGEISKPKIKNFIIGQEIILGNRDDLCGFIVRALVDFMKENKIDIGVEQNIGFTFSFPMDQKSVNSGFLIEWTKGFKVSGVEGQDIVALVQSEINRQGYPQIKIKVVLNDTVGTLALGKYDQDDCSLGVIIGTGTNGAYLEKISNISKNRALKSPTDEMMVNMEWGGFNFSNRNVYDEVLDYHSSNPQKQFLEKAVSGRYLGELASRVLWDLIVLEEVSFYKIGLEKGIILTTEDLSLIIGDKKDSYPTIHKIFAKQGVKSLTRTDIAAIKRISKAVIRRSARIVASMMVAVITKIDKDLNGQHSIAIDGSLYEKAHGYKEEVRSFMEKILGDKADKINLFVCKDGSGIGAAVVTAVVSQK